MHSNVPKLLINNLLITAITVLRNRAASLCLDISERLTRYNIDNLALKVLLCSF